MRGNDFRARVEAVFQKHTGRLGTFGAQVWFADHVGVTSRSISTATRPSAKVTKGPLLISLAAFEVLPRGSKQLKAILDRAKELKAAK